MEKSNLNLSQISTEDIKLWLHSFIGFANTENSMQFRKQLQDELFKRLKRKEKI